MRVDLRPPSWATHLLSDRTDWNRAPEPVADLKPFDLPDDAYYEYAWLDAAGERRPDPDNPHPRLNPWWPYACHLAGPEYRPDPVAAAATDHAQGGTTRLIVHSDLLDQDRPLLIYTPAGCRDATLPVILFQDGKAYYGWGRAPRILDLLLARGEVKPAHLVFVPPRERTVEYAFNPLYRRVLVEEILPAVAGRVAWDGSAVAWGASLGGLLSAELAWDRPDIFRTVVTQSGAFKFSADMNFTRPFGGSEAFLGRVAATGDPMPEIRWHLQCGRLEWLLDSNRHLAAALAERGASCTLQTFSAGHNWVNWTNGMASGYRAALGS